MIKVGIADYGMNVWYGGMMDYEARLEQIKAIGYEGLERLTPIDAADAVNKAAICAKLGMDFSTVLAPTLELKVQWTAAFGKKYIWSDVTANHAKDSMETYCRRVNYLVEAAKKYGVKVAVHNHLGCIVETQEQLDEFMAKCPEAGLVFDVGHMGVAGGNVREVFEKYYDRIVAIHLKEWVSTDPDAKDWWDRGYFCGLGQGNTPIDNEYVVKAAIEKGYDKWILIEHDTHKREPLEDLADSREILRKWGI